MIWAHVDAPTLITDMQSGPEVTLRTGLSDNMTLDLTLDLTVHQGLPPC